MNSSYFISIWIITFIDTCYRSQSHIIWNTLTYTNQIRGVSGSLHLAALPQPKETKIRGGSNPIRCGYNGHQNVYVLEMGSLGSHEKKKTQKMKRPRPRGKYAKSYLWISRAGQCYSWNWYRRIEENLIESSADGGGLTPEVQMPTWRIVSMH